MPITYERVKDDEELRSELADLYRRDGLAALCSRLGTGSPEPELLELLEEEIRKRLTVRLSKFAWNLGRLLTGTGATRH